MSSAPLGLSAREAMAAPKDSEEPTERSWRTGAVREDWSCWWLYEGEDVGRGEEVDEPEVGEVGVMGTRGKMSRGPVVMMGGREDSLVLGISTTGISTGGKSELSDESG